MPTDVQTPSSLVSAIGVIPPVVQHNLALVPVKPRVSPSQSGVMLQVSDIAEHDRKLADTLRAKLDFTDVLEGGSRLSAADAHGVLSWDQYERFEIIREGLMARDRAVANSSTIMRATAAGLALTVGALAALTDLPGTLVGLIGVVGGIFGMFFAAITADDVENAGKRKLEQVASKLKALSPPTAAETPANPEAQVS